MKKIKGLLSAFLGAAVMLSSAATAFAQDPQSAADTEKPDFYAPSLGLNVAEHSRDVIRQYINGHPFDMTRSAEYAKAPDGSIPYANYGKLSNTDLIEGRNALNVMRFIAGVGIQDVTLCPYATNYAQAAAVVLKHKGYLTHKIYNDIPGLNIQTLRYAQMGAENSNLASGFNNPAHSVVLGYMYDTNEKNIGELGHRRWCLNPPMYLTAFGQAGKFGTMWATDKQLSATNSGICWPAQNMPVEYFPNDTAWSISMCETVPADNIKVTLTRKSDLRVWTFSNEQADGYFKVNNDKSVPLYGCIIFRPDDVGGYSHGDVFNVKIDGLDKKVCYNVNFFALDGDDSVFDEPTSEPEESEPTSKQDGEPIAEPDDEQTSEPESEPTSVPDSGLTSVPDDEPTPEPESESTDSKPALEFKCEETDIQITADPEVFPADTRFKAQPIGSGCSATRYACDLSFICGGQTVQPNGSVRVSMPVPKGFESYGVLRVYHVENGRCSFVPSTVNNGRVCFTASSFSPYIITSEELDGELVELSTDGAEAENAPEVQADTQDNESAESSDAESSDVESSNVETNFGESSLDINESKPETAPSGNPDTGAALAMIPIALAACAAIAVFTKRK